MTITNYLKSGFQLFLCSNLTNDQKYKDNVAADFQSLEIAISIFQIPFNDQHCLVVHLFELSLFLRRNVGLKNITCTHFNLLPQVQRKRFLSNDEGWH